MNAVPAQKQTGLFYPQREKQEVKKTQQITEKNLYTLVSKTKKIVQLA